MSKRQKKLQEDANGQATPPQLPPVRNVPTWDRDAKIELFGYEWEVIFNSIANLQVLAQAAQSVMSRNIVNGTINMDFQKLDPTTLTYVEMTPEEKTPYVEDFQRVVEQMRNPVAPPTKQEAVPAETTEPAGKLVTMYEDEDGTGEEENSN